MFGKMRRIVTAIVALAIVMSVLLFTLVQEATLFALGVALATAVVFAFNGEDAIPRSLGRLRYFISLFAATGSATIISVAGGYFQINKRRRPGTGTVARHRTHDTLRRVQRDGTGITSIASNFDLSPPRPFIAAA
ncbi:MAG: hypothetical protein HYW37_01795 [Candidatus Colwellbacteria bacterium]|nr:hypothetical protein [Candidatus Colwellbacteria bacterium]